MPQNTNKQSPIASKICPICGTSPFAVPCPECTAEIDLIKRVEEMTPPPSIYDAEFWDE